MSAHHQVNWYERELKRVQLQLNICSRKMNRWTSCSPEFQELYKDRLFLESRVKEIQFGIDKKQKLVDAKEERRQARKNKKINHELLMKQHEENRISKQIAKQKRIEFENSMLGKLDRLVGKSLHKVKKYLA